MAIAGQKMIAGFAAAIALSGCQSAPTPGANAQDVEFMRGCWISRDPDGQTTTVRLLPARDGSNALAGAIMYYPQTEPPSHVDFTIARDGRSATSWWNGCSEYNNLSAAEIHGPRAPERPGWRKASWKLAKLESWFVADGDGERLRLWRSMGPDSGRILVIDFDGQRDGCD